MFGVNLIKFTFSCCGYFVRFAPKRYGFGELGSKNLGVKFKFKFKMCVKFELKFTKLDKRANLTLVVAQTD